MSSPNGTSRRRNSGVERCHSHLSVSFPIAQLFLSLIVICRNWWRNSKHVQWESSLSLRCQGSFCNFHARKSERTKLPHNEWRSHIHFRGTSFSHYIAINPTGCVLYLVSSWSRPRDMLFLTHDSSLIFGLALHHICPKTNLFLSVNGNSSSANHGVRQRGMLAHAEHKLR